MTTRTTGRIRTSHRNGRRTFWILIATVATALITSCSGTEPTFPDGSFAVVANADIGTGTSRILVGVVAPDGSRLGSPETELSFEVSHPLESDAVQTVDAIWTWIIEDAIGLWRADLSLDAEGPWQLTVVPEEGPALAGIQFLVRSETASPNIGEVAPTLHTPTIADKPIEALTTDGTPDLRFYETSLDEAVENQKKTVLVFATPAFCASAACGPLLNIAKGVAPSYPEVAFIHVEVFTGIEEPDFVPDASRLAPAAGSEFWNLPSEPWVFVIDEQGLVIARFEGVMSADELHSVLS